MEDEADELFCLEYEDRRSEIARLAHSTQRVPGMEPDDVAEEMAIALLIACRTYEPDQGTTLGQWWWACWMNRKSKLIEAFFATKRVRAEPVDPITLVDAFYPVLDQSDIIPPCPISDPTAHKVWFLLALGYRRNEIRRMLELPKRRYYAIIDSLTVTPLY